MVRRRSRMGKSKSEHQAGPGAKIILPRSGPDCGAGGRGHEVIELRKTPRQIPGQHNVDASACGDGERVLVAIAVQLEIRPRSTHQEFAEGNEVLKLPQIKAGAKKVTHEIPGHLIVASA